MTTPAAPDATPAPATDSTPCPTPAAQARKFVAATITAGASGYLARRGIALDPFESSVFASVVTGVVTYFIPNA